MKRILKIIENPEFIKTLFLIALFIVVYLVIRKIIMDTIEKDKKAHKLNKKELTILKLIQNISKYFLGIILVIMILEVNNISVTSVVAGLGIVSVIAGLALQDFLKDIIMGFNILVDDYYSVGDVLKIGEVTGKVLEIGFKTTKLRDIYNNNIFVIGNRNIASALNISTQFDIDIPLPYEEDAEKMEKLIKKMLTKIVKLEHLTNVEYKGINEFGDSAIFYKIRLYAKPEYQPQLKRDANRIIKIDLDKAKVSIPYTQIDIHNKK